MKNGMFAYCVLDLCVLRTVINIIEIMRIKMWGLPSLNEKDGVSCIIIIIRNKQRNKHFIQFVCPYPNYSLFDGSVTAFIR